MKHRVSHALFTYWNEIRGQRVAPRRFEIEPSRIAAILPDTFILDCGEPGHHRFRLAGTRMSSMMGRDVRDGELAGLFQRQDHAAIGHLVGQATDQGAVIVLTSVAAPLPGMADRPGVDGPEAILQAGDAAPGPRLEILLLPLFHTQEQVTRLLGCAVSLDPPRPGHGVPPAFQRLLDQETIWPDGRPHSVLQQLNRQSPFAPEHRGGRIVTADRRRFRVFDGGKSP